MTWIHLQPWAWAMAAMAAYLIGISKAGLAGVGVLGITLFTMVVPGRESTGLVLILLVCSDIVAVLAFHSHAVWSHLGRLLPWAAVGVIAGAVALGHVNDAQVRKMIGLILLGLVLMQARQLWWSQPLEGSPGERQSRLYAAAMGTLAGFVSMVANASGPIVTVALFAAGLPKMAFVGTGAWFFLLMNLFKTPFSYGLGLVNNASLGADLLLAPLAVLGVLTGRVLIRHIDQRLFEVLALSLTAVGALKLLF